MPHGTLSRPSTSYTSRPFTADSRRPSTTKSRTGLSSVNQQDIICAVIESRGVSPIVGIAFLNITSTEVILCQINDSQSYVRTIQKLQVYGPSVVLVPTYSNNASFKLHSSIEEHLDGRRITEIDRKYFAEKEGTQLLQQFAFLEDLDALNVSIKGYFYAMCCFTAVMNYVHNSLGFKYPPHSLRISYSTSEGSLMIDMSTISSMELLQNIENPKSKQCLFGLLNDTLTPMGARYLRTNILQPSTDVDKISGRLNAVAEILAKPEVLFFLRQAMKNFIDAEKILTDLIAIPQAPTMWYREQAINRIIMLKTFILAVPAIFQSLEVIQSPLLLTIQRNCDPILLQAVQQLIHSAVNDDVTFAKGALELRNQRIYAIRAGTEGMMDIARQTYKEVQDDSYEHNNALVTEHNVNSELKYESRRQFYIRIPIGDLQDRSLPPVFINAIKQKGYIECQTMTLLQFNQKMRDSECEIIQESDAIVEDLNIKIRGHIARLYRCSESIALLDMLCSFASLASSEDYTLPAISDTLALKEARHPIREKFQRQKYIANDVYATKSTRFQIITGCNMSGKSTYIRGVALACIMMQIGCFVPATHAFLPIIRQLFARIHNEDSIEDSASTFALEMREMASILHSIDRHSLAIIDELGRGTSTRDGLAIAVAISEALIESNALVWFATHFQDLVGILQARPGVISLHMSVEIAPDSNSMKMNYRIANGAVPNNHYGLAFARVFPLPPAMLDKAEEVSRVLHERVHSRKVASSVVIAQRKRKLLLTLKEHLEQAQNGLLEGEMLRSWLIHLQEEFVNRMSAIDEEAQKAREMENVY